MERTIFKKVWKKNYIVGGLLVKKLLLFFFWSLKKSKFISTFFFFNWCNILLLPAIQHCIFCCMPTVLETFKNTNSSNQWVSKRCLLKLQEFMISCILLCAFTEIYLMVVESFEPLINFVNLKFEQAIFGNFVLKFIILFWYTHSSYCAMFHIKILKVLEF